MPDFSGTKQTATRPLNPRLELDVAKIWHDVKTKISLEKMILMILINYGLCRNVLMQ